MLSAKSGPFQNQASKALDESNQKLALAPVVDAETTYSHLEDLNGLLSGNASSHLQELDISRMLGSRIGSAEQSNTSIIYDNSLILKIYRRMQAGLNPDVEIGRFLTEVAHFNNIPPFFGEIAITSEPGERTTIAMLQGLVANEGDGWAWFLKRLGGFYRNAARDSAPPSVPRPRFELNPPQDWTAEIDCETLEASALLGRRSAEMHIALSSSSSDLSFIPEPYSHRDLEADALQIELQIQSALKALKSSLSLLDESAADEAGLVLSKRLELIDRSRSILNLQNVGQRIRIHGDYHLGQTLRTSGDFILLDFEGEPARPLSQRRRKQSPLKDVAGMLRSFSYVAFAGLKEYKREVGESAYMRLNRILNQWCQAWERTASLAFLRAYQATIATNPALFPSLAGAETLLDAFLLEKALYELQYELNNRPAWIHIPLAGILKLWE